MKKRWKESTITEKIGLCGVIFTCIALIVLVILELITENVPNYALTAAVIVHMFFSAMMNWKRDKTMAIINIVIGVILLVVGFFVYL